ncbi:MAG: DUF4384 domain-containing protein [Gemmatimonadaceae bacterium]|nr:DUF4384 domain-containing protein [Gemmatimonadaceae bacterium]
MTAIRLVLLLSSAALSAQQTVDVQTRVLLSGDRTRAETERVARDQALAEAVRQVAGARVESAELTLRRDDERLAPYVQAIRLEANGVATAWKELRGEWITERHPQLGQQLYYALTLRVTVAKPAGPIDASFAATLRARADEVVVRSDVAAENDEVVVTLESTRDGYAMLFDIVDDSVFRLVPNVVVAEQRIAARAPTELPSEALRRAGLRFRASLPPGVMRRAELLTAVVTLDVVPAPDALTLAGFNQWLVSIPRDRRAVAVVPTLVRRAARAHVQDP